MQVMSHFSIVTLRRHAPRAARWMGFALLGLSILCGLALAGMQTSWVQRAAISAGLNPVLASRGLSAEVGDTGGFWPWRVSVREITLFDQDGAFATIESIDFTARPFVFLGGRLHLPQLQIAGGTIDRQPALATQETRTTRFPTFPEHLELPVEVLIDELTLENLVSNVGARSVTLAGDGQVRLTDTRWIGALNLDSGDGGGALEFEFNPSSRAAQIDFELADPNGSWLAPLVRLPEGAALSASLHLSGPSHALEVAGQATWPTARIATTGTIAWTDVIDATLSVHANGMTPQAWADLAGQRQDITVALHVDQQGAVTISSGEVSSGSLHATLAGSIAEDVNLSGQVTLAPGSAGRHNFASNHVREAQMDWVLAGSRDEPALTLSGNLQQFGIAGTEIDNSEINAVVAIGRNGRLADVAVEIAANGFEGGALPPQLLGEPLSARARFRADVERESANIEELVAVWGAVEIEGEGTVAVDRAMSFAGQVWVQDLALVHSEARGTARITFDARRRSREGPLTLSGGMETEGLQLPDQLARLFGDNPTATFDAEVLPLEINLTSFSLAGVGARATMGGRVDRGQNRVALSGSAELDDLGALDALLTGQATGTFDIQGPMDAPQVQAQGRSNAMTLGRAPLSNLVATVAGTPDQMQITATARSGDAPVELHYDFSHMPDVMIGELALQIAALRASGPLGIRNGEVTGSLALAADDIADAAVMVRAFGGTQDNLSVHGGLEGQVNLEGGLLSADVILTALRLDGIGSAANAAALELSGQVDVSDLRVIAAEAALRDALFGPSTFSSITATASGPLNALAVDLALRGPSDYPFEVDAAALRRESGAGSVVEITNFQGRSLGFIVALEQGGAIELGPNGVTLAETRFSVANTATGRVGTLAAQAQLWAGAPFVRLEAETVPAGALAVFGIPVDWTGTLNGLAVLDARGDGDRLAVDMRASNLTNDPDVSPLDVDLVARASGQDLVASLTVNDSSVNRSLVNAEMRGPLVWPSGVLVPPFDWDAPIEGAADIQSPLERLWLFVPIDTIGVAGMLEGAVEFGGSLGAPAANGSLNLTNGTLEHVQTGFLLADAQGALSFTQSGDINIDFRASDGNSGRARLTGTAHLPRAQAWQIEGGLRLNSLALGRRDELRAVASGNLELSGSLVDARLSGDLTMERIDAQIPNRLPPSVVEIEVVRIGADGAPIVRPADPVRRQQMRLPITLDVNVAIPNRAFIRGRGLDSEWGGSLALSGTMTAPRMRGTLDVLRGTFDFSRTRFALTQGQIVFTGGDRIDPSLAVRAEAPGPEFTSILIGSGRARAPSIRVTSDPVRPEETVMAQILFGKPPDELTALELIQIADAMATLSGRGGGGVLSGTRRALGLDFLSFDTGTSAEGNRNASVSVGQYVTPNIFVGTRRGAEAGSGSVTVEMGVSPNVTVDAEVRQDGQGSMGVDWRRDY